MLIDTADGAYDADASWAGMIRSPLTALVATSFPVKPPREWFEDPGFATLTPLTIEASGKISGHIASWRQSHIGLAGGVRAPRSKSRYAFFATGALECADGSMVNVGQLTHTGGHAALEASVAEAVAHYDDTRSAYADVTVGEDQHGIWVAGSLRPDVDDMKLRSIRASSVSGDWRPINGNLELVAVCSVNVPGFPTPRARVASGQVVALVAAGTEELVRISMADQLGIDVAGIVKEATSGVDERLRLVEDALQNRVGERRSELAPAIEAAKVKVLRAAALRDQVDGGPWIDGMPIEASVQECIQASLRAKVSMTATASKAWDSEARKKASESGVALPDGSYPIRDRADWRKARQALGRAKNRARVIRHIKKRGRALGVSQDEIEKVGKS